MSDRQRQDNITRGAQQEVTQPLGTNAPTSPFQRIPGVIKEVPTTPSGTFKLRWQAIAYQDTPPKKDAFKYVGEVRDGYPMEGLDRSAYESLVVSGAFTAGSAMIFAYKRGGVWIIEPVRTGGGLNLCLVHAPLNGGTNWASPLTDFIRVVHFKPNATGTGYVTAERTTPIPPEEIAPGYSQAKCWPGTRSDFWQYLKSTQGTAPNFTPMTTAVFVGTVMIGGVEYISPIMPITMFQPDTALPLGSC